VLCLLLPHCFTLPISLLQGENTKMSASDSNSAIYVTDIHEEIKNKVCLEHCFSEIYL
jgi:tryptophanyl-tRNA synthetase